MVSEEGLSCRMSNSIDLTKTLMAHLLEYTGYEDVPKRPLRYIFIACIFDYFVVLHIQIT